MAETITVIRNADRILAWNADATTHAYVSGGDLAFRGNAILQVGGRFAGKADHEIDGRGRMVLPGLVNVHSHPSSEPGNKGLLEELGSPGLGQSSLYEFMPIFLRFGPEGVRAAQLVAMAELLQSGVTTICDLSLPRAGWADDLAATGIRAVLCPMFRSAAWRTDDGHSVTYQWDEKAGKKSCAIHLP